MLALLMGDGMFVSALKRVWRSVATVITVAICSACSVSPVSEDVVPEDVRAFVAQVEAAAIAEDVEALRALFHPLAEEAVTDEAFSTITDILPNEGALATRWVSFSDQPISGEESVDNLIYIVRELRFSGGEVIVVQHRMTRVETGLRLLYLRVTPITSEQAASQTFSLRGASTTQYVVFAFLVGLPALSLLTIIAIWLTPRLKLRVLWTVFCLIGFGELHYNWTAGGFSLGMLEATSNGVKFNFIQIVLLSAGFVKAGFYAPWIVKLSLPVGVVAYWCARILGRLPRHPPSAPIAPEITPPASPPS